MEFRTEVKPLTLQGTINYHKQVLMIGSCFTDYVGKRMMADMFRVSVNPFGPLFNPISIAQAIDRLVSGRKYTPDELFKADGLWHSYDFHSLFSSFDPKMALSAINRTIEAFVTPDVAIITLGSDATFTLKSEGRVVANCHKQPQSLFELRHRSLAEIVETLRGIVDKLCQLNPNVKIIFTVSPVRHLSYGAAANSRSKARLIEATHIVAESRPDTVLYFPAYEIMYDDLRDYRFYAADMVHPSDVAVDYIYRNFSESFYDPATQAIAAEARRLSRRFAHRPLTDNVEGYKKFQADTEALARELMARYPELAPSIQVLLI